MSNVRKPYFILGAPRSGTSWFAAVLDSHEDVLHLHEPFRAGILSADEITVNPIELIEDGTALHRDVIRPPYFNKSFLSGSVSYRHLTWLATSVGVTSPFKRSIKPANSEAFLLGIKDTLTPEGLDWAKSFFRILVLIRNPINCIASQFEGEMLRQMQIGTGGTWAFFEKYCPEYVSGIVNRSEFENAERPLQLAYRWIGFHLLALLKHLPDREVLFYDKFRRAPEEFESLFRGLGLSIGQQTQTYISTGKTPSLIDKLVETKKPFYSLRRCKDRDARKLLSDAQIAQIKNLVRQKFEQFELSGITNQLETLW